VDLEITPAPTDAERAAIVAALALEGAEQEEAAAPEPPPEDDESA
jgi:hypothetical protein